MKTGHLINSKRQGFNQQWPLQRVKLPHKPLFRGRRDLFVFDFKRLDTGTD